jgi:teichuronic acid biosynthesis glycosyltransferase TuaC
MRVLVVTNMYPSEERPGVGAVVADQVEDLRSLGVSVELIVIRGALGRRRYLAGAVEVGRRVRRTRFDVVHAHYGLTGVVAATQRRVPVVTTFHGSDTGYVRWQGRVSRVVARVTTPIFVTRDGAARLGLPDADVIACGVDLELFSPVDPSDARKALGWDPDVPVALLPGARANAVKRADLFDAAVREARISCPALQARTLDHLARPEVARYLNAASVTVLTSESEGSPVTIKESLACGTPVVSVPVGDIPELITGLPGCAVADRDPKALAAGILAAIRAGHAGVLRERVEPFSRQSSARRVLEVYERVAGSSASSKTSAARSAA